MFQENVPCVRFPPRMRVMQGMVPSLQSLKMLADFLRIYLKYEGHMYLSLDLMNMECNGI